MTKTIQKALERRASGEREAGFTLIELIVVMIIIGVLAAIALPVFLSQIDKSRITSVKADLHNVSLASESFYTTNLSYPSINVDTDGTLTTTPTGIKLNHSKGNVITTKVNTTNTLCIQAYNADSDESSAYYYANSDGVGGVTGVKAGVHKGTCAAPIAD